ncbi:MAG: protein-L-isoaspartate(D-aspartate) O-methyltransferase [Anaerolineae bacterium]
MAARPKPRFRVLILLSLAMPAMVVACSTPTMQPPTLTDRPSKTAAVADATAEATQDPYRERRLEMVAETIEARGVSDPDVLNAMRSVPRHQFVPSDYQDQAYADHPLPIGYGQTISQPYIVAWMTELLELEHGEKVLEIGTGSGYQAAVLAELGYVEVYSIEIIPELATRAEEQLRAAGYTDVHVKQGDGYYGWPEHAPYDAIIVTAAPDHLPQPLAEQLAEEGRLVIPMGPPGGYQDLWRFEKEGEELQAQKLGGVRFVPFTREE